MTYNAAIVELQDLLKEGHQPILSLSGFLAQANHAVREHPTGEFRLVSLDRISTSMAKASLLGAEFTGNSANSIYYDKACEIVFSYPLDHIEILSRTGVIKDNHGRDTRLVLAERLCPNPLGLSKWAKDMAVECFMNRDMTSALSIAVFFYLNTVDRQLAPEQPIRVNKTETKKRDTRDRELPARLSIGMGM